MSYTKAKKDDTGARFVKAVQERLGELGWTQNRLAQELGIGRSRVTQILRYNASVRTSTITRWCKVLGIDVRFVIG